MGPRELPIRLLSLTGERLKLLVLPLELDVELEQFLEADFVLLLKQLTQSCVLLSQASNLLVPVIRSSRWAFHQPDRSGVLGTEEHRLRLQGLSNKLDETGLPQKSFRQ